MQGKRTFWGESPQGAELVNEPKQIAKDKVQTARNAQKEVLGKTLPQRTEITYKAYLMDETEHEVKILKT